MVACLLPDKGSLNVIRRSLMPFDNPVSFLTRSDLMAKPTPASRLSSLLRPLQKNVKPAPTYLKSPISAKRVSLRAAISIPYLPSSLPTRAVLCCGLSDPALSIRVSAFHAPIFKGITFVFLFCFRPLKGIPADRG